MLGHPDHVKQVFTGDPNVLHAGEGNNILKPLLGRAQGAPARRQGAHADRKALLPPFHGERMQAYGDMIRAIAQARGHGLAARRAARRAPAHAGADARGHHARRLRLSDAPARALLRALDWTAGPAQMVSW